MSDYTKSTNFATKDSLATGNPGKIIKGTEIDTEFNAISSAIASKAEQSDIESAITEAFSGKIVQIVYGQAASHVDSTAPVFVDTGLSATITPTSASSKILILISHPENNKQASSSGNYYVFNICRNNSSIIEFTIAMAAEGSYAKELHFSTGFNYLDTPSSVSALTYKTQFRNNTTAGQINVMNGDTPSSITLMEISA